MTAISKIAEWRMAVEDEVLFKRYVAGDADSFEELVERYRGPLHTVVYRMVLDREEAEDIFQETFIRVVRNRERFDPDKKFSTWVYAIATNLCRDLARSRARKPAERLPERLEPSAHNDPERESFGREIGAALEEALARLPEEQREVFLLRENAGLAFKEIAEMTDSNLNTVLGRMHQAVKKLRLELGDYMEAMS